jgi:hypothetical protein
MVKRVVFWVAFLFFSGISMLLALPIHLAPISYVDETQDRVDQSSSVQSELLAGLRAVPTGTALQFFSVRNSVILSPQSLLEAARICRAENLEYLLYGYVAKKDYTVTAEIKLFEAASGRVLQVFYSADDHAHYERMIRDVAGKILAYVIEEFRLEVLEKKTEYAHLSLPITLGYWTPLQAQWTDVLLGTAVLSGGITYIPTDNLFVEWGMPFYNSLSCELSYRFGIGNPDAYKAFDHSIAVMLPLRLHARLSESQNIFIGIGPLYAVDILQIQEKYKPAATKLYGVVGIAVSLGCGFKLDEAKSLIFDNIAEFRFYDTIMPVYSLRVGLDFRLMSEEVLRKW